MQTALVQRPSIIDLHRLADLIWSVEADTRQPADEIRLPASHGRSFAIPRGVVHEWFAEATDGAAGWTAPLCLLAHLAAASLADRPGTHAVWIGRRCWPSVRTLISRDDRSLLRRSIFIDPPDPGSRLWAIDAALRCPAVAAVIADGSGLRMAPTRRLQLAAAHGGSLPLIARPPRERSHLSAAAVRWLVRCARSETDAPRWSVELLRRKGVRPTSEETRSWTAEWDHEHGLVLAPADLARRPAPQARPAAALRTA